ASVSSRIRINSARNNSVGNSSNSSNRIRIGKDASNNRTNRTRICSDASSNNVGSRSNSSNRTSRARIGGGGNSQLASIPIAQTTTNSATGAGIKSSALISIVRNSIASRVGLSSSSACSSSNDAAHSWPISNAIYSA